MNSRENLHTESKYKSFPYKKTNFTYVFLSDNKLFNSTLGKANPSKNLDFYIEAYSPTLYENKPNSLFFLVDAEIESRNILDRKLAQYIDVSQDIFWLVGLLFNDKTLSELNEIECAQVCDIIVTCFYNKRKSNDDFYSIDVDKIFRIPIRQYISEERQCYQLGMIPIDALYHLTIEKPKIIIDAIAGCGKSTALVSLYNRHFVNYFHSIGIRKMIIAVPTTAIAQQLFFDFNKKHEHLFDELMQSGTIDAKTKKQMSTKFREVTILTNGMRADRIDFAINHSFVTITCFDSICKFPNSILRESLCIVDEYHQLVNDINYRASDRFLTAFDKISTCKRKILMSATPNYHFAKNYDERLNYEVVRFEPEIKNKIIIQPYVYTSTMKELPFYVFELAKENEQSDKGLIFAKFDSVVDLATTHDYFNSKGIKTEYFHSKDRKRKEDNENYKKLMQTGSIDNDIELCLSTTLLEAGVSIKNDVKLLALIDCDKYQKAVQLINRPRMQADDIDKNGDQDHLASETIQVKNKEVNVVMFRNASRDKRLKKVKRISAAVHFRKASELVEVWNNYGYRKAKRHALDTDMQFDKYVYFDDNEIAQINILEILHEVYVAENNCDFNTMLNQIKRADDRVIIKEIQELERRDSLDEFKHLRNELVETNKTNREYLFRLLQNRDTRDITLQSICFLSKDVTLKIKAQDTLNIPEINREACRDFINEHERAFINTKHGKLLKDVDFLVSDIVNNRDNLIDEAIDICKESSSHTIRSAKNTLKSIRRQKKLASEPDSLSAGDRFNAEMDNMFRRRIEDKNFRIPKGQNQYIWTGEMIMKIANKVRKKESNNGNLKPLTEKGAMRLLRSLFVVAQKNVKVGKKTARFYKIVSRKTQKNVDQIFTK